MSVSSSSFADRVTNVNVNININKKKKKEDGPGDLVGTRAKAASGLAKAVTESVRRVTNVTANV